MFDGFVFYRPLEEFKLVNGLPGFMENGFFEEAVKETEMLDKVLSGLKKQPATPVDKEELKRLNDIQVTSIPNLDSMKVSIEKWLR